MPQISRLGSPAPRKLSLVSISGGKVLSERTKRRANRVRQALKMVAMGLSHANSATTPNSPNAASPPSNVAPLTWASGLAQFGADPRL